MKKDECPSCAGLEIEDLDSCCQACQEECAEVADLQLPTSSFLTSYRQHVQERASMAQGFGVAPKPLNASQVEQLLQELGGEETDTLLTLLSMRVPPGVDEAAGAKAQFLANVALNKEPSPFMTRECAIQLLGTMQGGYNVAPLIELLQDKSIEIANLAAKELKNTLLVFDAFHDIAELYKQGCAPAKQVLKSWAAAEWFLCKPPSTTQDDSDCI